MVYYVRIDDKFMVIMTNKTLLLVKNGEKSSQLIVQQIKFAACYKNRKGYSMRIGGNS
jgi:hypothetical protein